MKHYVILTLLLIFNLNVFAQIKNSFEINFGTIYQVQAKYKTTYNSLPPAPITMSGFSNSISATAKKAISKNTAIYLGLGYQFLGINKIRFKGGIGNDVKKSRFIDYTAPDGTKLGTNTDNYKYHNTSLTVGGSYTFTKNSKLNKIVGADLILLKTYKQSYFINIYDENFNLNNSRFLGYVFNSYIGFNQQFGNKNNYYILPKLILPIYQNLNRDIIFKEIENEKMKKILGGLGINFTIGRFI